MTNICSEAQIACVIQRFRELSNGCTVPNFGCLDANISNATTEAIKTLDKLKNSSQNQKKQIDALKQQVETLQRQAEDLQKQVEKKQKEEEQKKIAEQAAADEAKKKAQEAEKQKASETSVDKNKENANIKATTTQNITPPPTTKNPEQKSNAATQRYVKRQVPYLTQAEEMSVTQVENSPWSAIVQWVDVNLSSNLQWYVVFGVSGSGNCNYPWTYGRTKEEAEAVAREFSNDFLGYFEQTPTKPWPEKTIMETAQKSGLVPVVNLNTKRSPYLEKGKFCW